MRRWNKSSHVPVISPSNLHCLQIPTKIIYLLCFLSPVASRSSFIAPQSLPCYSIYKLRNFGTKGRSLVYSFLLDLEITLAHIKKFRSQTPAKFLRLLSFARKFPLPISTWRTKYKGKSIQFSLFSSSVVCLSPPGTFTMRSFLQLKIHFTIIQMAFHIRTGICVELLAATTLAKF